ncbi:sigma-70 family RNA polymerase sigma factor [Longimicrobium sp.]|jgi:RNA polymerase sigma factor for flagellar operon FliA|uniref:sigma-70 family RNA polymerase sigma factor n=1 Tax=Longimicrobium sp. TaxID=2029185 RepID=UPI002EDAE459
MPDRLESESLFLEHLRHIERVAEMTCNDHGVRGAEAEDFVSWIKLRLMEDDYAIIQRFRAESSIKTYLATVVSRQFFEYWRAMRGRWRASAMAERLGPPAKDLEILVYREGYSLAQAGEKLRTAGRTQLSDTELARLLARLPEHSRHRPKEVSTDSVLDEMPSKSQPDMDLGETDAFRARMLSALDRVMSQLDPENRLIFRMRFADGHSLADVARVLGLEQKPLYRRVEKLRQRLRTALEAEGVQDTDVRGIFLEEDGS